MSTNFPVSLQDLDATRGSGSDSLNSPSHATHHALEDDTVEALQAKVGIDSSAVATSLDYKVSNSLSISPGHLHTSADLTDLAPISSSVGVADAGKLVKLDGYGVLDDSFLARNTQTFTSTDTWTKPTGANFVVVELMGAGGGGGQGYCEGGTSDVQGGGGGASGGYSKHIFLADSLGATETVTIGSGGAGGSGQTDGVGVTGSTGGSVTFGDWLIAYGGTGGVGGAGSGSYTTEATGGVGFTSDGNTGASGGYSTVDGATASSSIIVATGGGGGGGSTGGDEPGGAGGAMTPYTIAGGTAGAGSGDNGGDGNEPTDTSEMIGGTGGGGGASDNAGAGGIGGAGGRGAGGGGGGAGASTQVGGAGGAGGDGFARITTF